MAVPHTRCWHRGGLRPAPRWRLTTGCNPQRRSRHEMSHMHHAEAAIVIATRQQRHSTAQPGGADPTAPQQRAPLSQHPRSQDAKHRRECVSRAQDCSRSRAHISPGAAAIMRACSCAFVADAPEVADIYPNPIALHRAAGQRCWLGGLGVGRAAVTRSCIRVRDAPHRTAAPAVVN